MLASVDARDNAVSLFAWRDGRLRPDRLDHHRPAPAQIISADLSGDGWDDLVVRDAGDGTISVYFSASDSTIPIPAFMGPERHGRACSSVFRSESPSDWEFPTSTRSIRREAAGLISSSPTS